MESVINYINSNLHNYINELIEYLKIPSISTLESHKEDVNKCAEFIANKLKDAGMTRVEIFQTEKHPIVYGEWLGAQNKPTVLIYGHYDVQPVDPLELWKSPPFEPVIEDGKIWARGANDNKGQHFVHVKSVESFFKTHGSLPLNVKFIIEGEEEIGSDSLYSFIKNNKELLKCDAVLISDTSMYDKNVPTISYGLRGLLYTEIEVTGPKADLHSGTFGGAVANPINELAKIISKLHDKNGKVTIPNFYKDVLKLSKEEKENFNRLKFSDKKFAKELGVKELQGEKGFSTLERLWVRPTLDCNGIVGGFTEKGAKTVLPSKAIAKVSMRLVPNQNPHKIFKEFSNYVKSLAPKSVKVDVRMLHYGYPVITPLNSKAIEAASKAVSKAFGKKTVFTREGGSIPIVVEFMKHLKAPAVLMGLGLDTDNIHSPNEHFHIENFEKGILSSVYFIDEFSKV
ncbi:dipeptidase [Rosettibacter firmus]|uniref:dipeptidase n=1 Tax=Rosettibacter firmus TaxID=3111522 RepID=UPI00336BBC8E